MFHTQRFSGSTLTSPLRNKWTNQAKRASLALPLAWCLSLSLGLAACGGGGSDASPLAAPPVSALPTPTPAPGTCTKLHPRVGEVTTLSTLAHKVSGVATIVDDCTLQISNFNYDGGGLSEVRIYGAINKEFTKGFAIGDNLKGTVYTGQTLTAMLKPGDLDRLDSISIWCTDANANFGDGAFARPK